MKIYMVSDSSTKGGGGKKSGTKASNRKPRKQSKPRDDFYGNPNWDPFA